MASNALALRVRAPPLALTATTPPQVFRMQLRRACDGLLIFHILFGTWHDGSDEAHERMNKRLEERRWAEKAAVG